MGFINSPNMQFPVPTVSNEPGPQYATDINSALLTIDSHNHSPGQGVPIGAQGINLTTDLPFNVNNATSLRTTRFVSTTATSGTDIGCVYVKGVDLFYNDLNGNVIPVTRNGALASTAVFLGQISTTAIVSANSGVPASSGFIRMDNNIDFVSWRNAANAADDKIYFDNSDIFRIVGPTFDYKFPTTFPTSTLPLSMSPTGVISSSVITRPQLPNVGQQISTGSGLFTTTSGSFVDVTNLSVTITTTGRPVFISVQPDLASTAASPSLAGQSANFRVLKGPNTVASAGIGGSAEINVPPASFSFLDATPPSSSYTYKLQASVGAGTARVSNCILVAYEL